MDAISIQDVSKTFGEKVAVTGLSLKIPAGSLHGLIGPNGAGKTTTIRMILNIYAPDTGRIDVLGSPMSERQKSRIGYLPEERGLYTRMKVGDVLIFSAGIKGMRASRSAPKAKEWLSRLGLGDCWEKKLQELSKGMQQKVQFIATILHDPELVVLDEPFSGLDPINTNVLRDIIMEMKGAGRTVIFSTHMMDQVEKLCDSVCMINNGKKVLDGSLQDVKRSYTKNMVTLSFDGDGAFLTGHPLVSRTIARKGQMDIALAEGADPQELLKDAAAKVRINKFEISEPSMHDIFVERVESTAGGNAGA